MFKLSLKTNALSLGARGEKAAITYLKNAGYKILETNFCNQAGRRLGEIDIIAQDGKEIVFIEVKTREIALNRSILPEENINRTKLYKLNKIATFYLSSKKLYSIPHRFDAISILANSKNSRARLKHLKNIFI